MCSEAGPRCRRNSSDADSDSGLKIPTPTPTPFWLRPNKNYSILKEQYQVNTVLISISVHPKRYAAIQHPFALTVDATWLWLSLIPLNVVGVIVLELIAIVTQPSRWP